MIIPLCDSKIIYIQHYYKFIANPPPAFCSPTILGSLETQLMSFNAAFASVLWLRCGLSLPKGMLKCHCHCVRVRDETFKRWLRGIDAFLQRVGLLSLEWVWWSKPMPLHLFHLKLTCPFTSHHELKQQDASQFEQMPAPCPQASQPPEL